MYCHDESFEEEATRDLTHWKGKHKKYLMFLNKHLAYVLLLLIFPPLLPGGQFAQGMVGGLCLQTKDSNINFVKKHAALSQEIQCHLLGNDRGKFQKTQDHIIHNSREPSFYYLDIYQRLTNQQ